MDDYGKSSVMGFEENIVAAASYFGFLGLVILILEKKSSYVRFHAIQSTLGFAVIAALWIALKISMPFLTFVPGLLALIFAVFMMIKAHECEEYKVPIIGNLAHSAVFDSGQEKEDLLAEKPGDEDNAIYGGRI